jgi:hypothetical protein
MHRLIAATRCHIAGAMWTAIVYLMWDTLAGLFRWLAITIDYSFV